MAVIYFRTVKLSCIWDIFWGSGGKGVVINQLLIAVFICLSIWSSSVDYQSDAALNYLSFLRLTLQNSFMLYMRQGHYWMKLKWRCQDSVNWAHLRKVNGMEWQFWKCCQLFLVLKIPIVGFFTMCCNNTLQPHRPPPCSQTVSGYAYFCTDQFNISLPIFIRSVWLFKR